MGTLIIELITLDQILKLKVFELHLFERLVDHKFTKNQILRQIFLQGVYVLSATRVTIIEQTWQVDRIKFNFLRPM